MSAMLYRSGLMDIDMSGRRAKDTLIGTEDRRYDGRVCLCSADKKMHIHIFPADSLADSFPRRSAIMILAVTDGLFKIGFDQALHDTRMRSFVIVTLKLVHMSAVLSETNISNSSVFSVSLLNKTEAI